MHKELIERLRFKTGVLELQELKNEAADAIESLEKVSNQYQETALWQAGRISELLDEKALLEDKLKQEKETNLNQHNQLMKALSEKVTLWDEVERLERLQFRQAPCRRFCESTAYEIQIKQLKATCEFALDALKNCYDVDSYPTNGKTEQDTAIAKLQGALQ
jgi:hypothetical protein